MVLIRHLGAPTSTPPYSSLGLGQLGMPHTQRVRMQVRDLHVKDLAPRLGSTDVPTMALSVLVHRIGSICVTAANLPSNKMPPDDGCPLPEVGDHTQLSRVPRRAVPR